VAEGVKRIVDYINAHSGCTRRQLIEALAPSPPRPVAVAPATPASAEGAVVSEPTAERVAAVPVPAPSAAPPSSGDLQEPTPEQTAVIADLHWLIHQGHVIEFANGRIETARKPIPKPPRPGPKSAEAVAQPADSGDETTATPEATGDADSAVQPEVIAESNPPNRETALPTVPDDGERYAAAVVDITSPADSLSGGSWWVACVFNASYRSLLPSAANSAFKLACAAVQHGQGPATLVNFFRTQFVGRLLLVALLGPCLCPLNCSATATTLCCALAP